MARPLSWITVLVACTALESAPVQAGPPAKPAALDDCKIKPILGAKVAQAQDDAGIELSYSSEQGFEPSKLRLPLYGYWCGPNYPLPGSSPAPFDKLDALCMAHDKCYERSSYSDCGCDAQLVASLRAAMKAGEDQVRCRRGGKWTTERNPFYLYVEHYFAQDMAKRSCNALARPASTETR